MGEAVSYCSRCGTMVGGRRPSESGEFRAGAETLCKTCDNKAKPPAPPKPAPPPPRKPSAPWRGRRVPTPYSDSRKPPTNRRRRTNRMTINRAPRKPKSNLVLFLVLGGIGLALLIVLAVAIASK